MGEGELASAFRLRSKCPEAQPLAFARTYMEASTDPFSAFNGAAKRQCQRLDLSLLRPAILLTPPHPPLLPDVGHGLRG